MSVFISEILETSPPRDAFDEVFFGEESGPFTWVKFSNDQVSWVGAFQTGPYNSRKKCFVFEDRAVLLANSSLYLIELSARKATLMEPGLFQDLIADSSQFFAAAFTHIHAYSYTGFHKAMEGWYFDMFRFESIDEKFVRASFYQTGGDWTSLIIDRAELHIRGKKIGRLIQRHADHFSSEAAVSANRYRR